MNDLLGFGLGLVLDLVLQMALAVALTVSVLRWDMKRSPPERLARAWNKASFWSAVGAFGPFCIPFYFARTRKSFRGFLLGVVWAIGVLVAVELAGEALDAALGFTGLAPSMDVTTPVLD